MTKSINSPLGIIHHLADMKKNWGVCLLCIGVTKDLASSSFKSATKWLVRITSTSCWGCLLASIVAVDGYYLQSLGCPETLLSITIILWSTLCVFLWYFSQGLQSPRWKIPLCSHFKPRAFMGRSLYFIVTTTSSKALLILHFP